MKWGRYPKLEEDYLIGTITDHRIRLTGPSLAVSEKAAVITFPSIRQNLQTDFLKDLPLISILVCFGPK